MLARCAAFSLTSQQAHNLTSYPLSNCCCSSMLISVDGDDEDEDGVVKSIELHTFCMVPCAALGLLCFILTSTQILS